jgi:hypothetical protein
MRRVVLEGDLPARDAPERVAAEEEIVSLLSRSLPQIPGTAETVAAARALGRYAGRIHARKRVLAQRPDQAG